MGYKELEKKLRIRGDKELDRINVKYDSEIEAVKTENKSQAKTAGSKLKKELGSENKLRYLKTIGQHKSSLESQLNHRKRELCDMILDVAKEEIVGSTEEDKARFLKGLVKDRQHLPEDSKVMVDKRYAGLVKGVENVEAVDLGDFGLLIESSDGMVKVDNTLETLFQTKDMLLRPKIMDALFGDQR